MSEPCGAAGGHQIGQDQFSRSTNSVSPSVIGFRASDAVELAGLLDLVSHRGGRASAAAPMAG
jgi:hypothetical protein